MSSKKSASQPRKKVPVTSVHVNQLQEAARQVKSAHRKARTTQKVYHNYVLQGRAFLEGLAQGHQVPAGVPPEAAVSSDADQDPLLTAAFDAAPNCRSPEALVLFLIFKCDTNNLSMSTADGIYSAFKDYWDQ